MNYYMNGSIPLAPFSKGEFSESSVIVRNTANVFCLFWDMAKATAFGLPKALIVLSASDSTITNMISQNEDGCDSFQILGKKGARGIDSSMHNINESTTTLIL